MSPFLVVALAGAGTFLLRISMLVVHFSPVLLGFTAIVAAMDQPYSHRHCQRRWHLQRQMPPDLLSSLRSCSSTVALVFVATRTVRVRA